MPAETLSPSTVSHAPFNRTEEERPAAMIRVPAIADDVRAGAIYRAHDFFAQPCCTLTSYATALNAQYDDQFVVRTLGFVYRHDDLAQQIADPFHQRLLAELAPAEPGTTTPPRLTVTDTEVRA